MHLECFMVVALFLVSANSSNILIIFEVPRRSHQIWISPLAEALLDQGHNITFVSPFSDTLERIKAKVIEPIPDEGESKKNKFYSINLEGVYKVYSTFNKTQLSHLPREDSQNIIYNDYYKLCDHIYKTEGFQRIWNYPFYFKFDLILMDISMGNCSYPLIQKFKSASVIGYSPSALDISLVKRLSFRNSSKSSFFRRLETYFQTKVKHILDQDRQSIERLAEKHLKLSFNFNNLEKSIALCLVNYNSVLNERHVLGSNIVPVGGLHLKDAEEMPNILSMVLNNAMNGFIFFSMGTDVQPEVLGIEKTKTIAEAFGKLVQTTVVWRNYSVKSNLPENIFVHAWMPQNDLLGHPHMKLLITTGGLLSLQEAIYHGVPVIGIPIYGDHNENIKIITENELGVKLDFNDVNADTVYGAINVVLQNSKYKENMKEFSKKFRENLGNPLKKALLWINYTLSNNDEKLSRELSNSSTSFWDVEIFLFSVIVWFGLSITYLIYKILNKAFINSSLSKYVKKNQ